jgi:hypothetical protein
MRILTVFGLLQLSIQGAQLREFLVGWLQFFLAPSLHFLLTMVR